MASSACTEDAEERVSMGVFITEADYGGHGDARLMATDSSVFTTRRAVPPPRHPLTPNAPNRPWSAASGLARLTADANARHRSRPFTAEPSSGAQFYTAAPPPPPPPRHCAPPQVRRHVSLTLPGKPPSPETTRVRASICDETPEAAISRIEDLLRQLKTCFTGKEPPVDGTLPRRPEPPSGLPKHKRHGGSQLLSKSGSTRRSKQEELVAVYMCDPKEKQKLEQRVRAIKRQRQGRNNIVERNRVIQGRLTGHYKERVGRERSARKRKDLKLHQQRVLHLQRARRARLVASLGQKSPAASAGAPCRCPSVSPRKPDASPPAKPRPLKRGAS
ncbi:hypothetical protein DIPPA_01991 [Diplonema papillatum]|nr:hypothetical protein DIPPA_01991 [Diplonema papillatum]